jgi:hypothetical protein
MRNPAQVAISCRRGRSRSRARALGDLRRAHRAHDHYRAGTPVSL